ncbi:lysine 6-monooxygenase [Streptomyces griseocarneus]|nr:lysine 6-monooxygenase [Streptomyces griseocarneus]
MTSLTTASRLRPADPPAHHDGGAPLLVIGAGPKAIALAAKSSVLRSLGFEAPEVVAVERARTAANWHAGGGWTNGRQHLGTLPEKDLGFPYDHSVWGGQDWAAREIARRMSGFSWTSHLLAQGTYARWIDRGRPQPSHREWADYLLWAAREAGLRTVTGEVLGAETEHGGWQLTVEGTAGRETVRGRGLVVSGPGPVTGALAADGVRVLDTAGFWRLSLDGIPDHVRSVVVVGAGETAGTIVRELACAMERDVTVVTPRATLFSRGESTFENRYYSNPRGWTGLSEADRREFIRRTDRAVFSQDVQRDLALTDRVGWEPGRVVAAEAPADGPVRVTLSYAGRERDLRADLVVDATGGDPLWFTRVLGPRAQDELRAALGGPVTRERVERSIDWSLTVAGLSAPLHLPNLAALAQGPGFPNLSALGLLSDRVLAAHVPRTTSGDSDGDDAHVPLGSGVPAPVAPQGETLR